MAQTKNTARKAHGLKPQRAVKTPKQIIPVKVPKTSVPNTGGIKKPHRY